MKKTHQFHDGKAGAALAVRVLTHAPHTELVGIQEDGTLKIRLAAVPQKGKANEVLLDYLADVLGVAPGKLELVAGMTGRNKLVTVTGLSSTEINQRILKRLSQ
jgi:uncharacterized protein YggU (UPF0235/DUF167 family)